MAFLSKVGNIVRHTASKQMGNEISASRPSIYQAIRCMSSSKLFVGGISYATDDTSLREAFGKYGEVIEARVILDRDTGRSRGFGFITYTSSEEASSAIQALDGQDLHGRRIRVNYANDRPRGGFGGGGFGGGGYGGGGGGYGDAAAGGYVAGGGFGAGGGGYGAGGGGYNNYGGGFGGSGGNYGGGNSGGGFDNFGSGGNSPSNYSSGASGDYASSGAGTGYGNTFESGDQFGAKESGSTGGFGESSGLGFGEQFGDNNNNSAGNFNQDDPSEANYRDDDDDGDFAKRA